MDDRDTFTVTFTKGDMNTKLNAYLKASNITLDDIREFILTNIKSKNKQDKKQDNEQEISNLDTDISEILELTIAEIISGFINTDENRRTRNKTKTGDAANSMSNLSKKKTITFTFTRKYQQSTYKPKQYKIDPDIDFTKNDIREEFFNPSQIQHKRFTFKTIESFMKYIIKQNVLDKLHDETISRCVNNGKLHQSINLRRSIDQSYSNPNKFKIDLLKLRVCRRNQILPILRGFLDSGLYTVGGAKNILSFLIQSLNIKNVNLSLYLNEGQHLQLIQSILNELNQDKTATNGNMEETVLMLDTQQSKLKQSESTVAIDKKSGKRKFSEFTQTSQTTQTSGKTVIIDNAGALKDKFLDDKDNITSVQSIIMQVDGSNRDNASKTYEKSKTIPTDRIRNIVFELWFNDDFNQTVEVMVITDNGIPTGRVNIILTLTLNGNTYTYTISDINMFVNGYDNPAFSNIESIMHMISLMKDNEDKFVKEFTPISYSEKMIGDFFMNLTAMLYCFDDDISLMHNIEKPTIKNVCILATDRMSNAIAIELLTDTISDKESNVENFFVVSTAGGLITSATITNMSIKNKEIKHDDTFIIHRDLINILQYALTDFKCSIRQISIPGFDIIENEGGGNCLFLALNDSAIHAPNAQALRHHIMDNFNSDNIFFVPTGSVTNSDQKNRSYRNIEEYRTLMRLNGSWGDETVIYNYAMIYERDVVVYVCDNHNIQSIYIYHPDGTYITINYNTGEVSFYTQNDVIQSNINEITRDSSIQMNQISAERLTEIFQLENPIFIAQFNDSFVRHFVRLESVDIDNQPSKRRKKGGNLNIIPGVNLKSVCDTDIIFRFDTIDLESQEEHKENFNRFLKKISKMWSKIKDNIVVTFTQENNTDRDRDYTFLISSLKSALVIYGLYQDDQDESRSNKITNAPTYTPQRSRKNEMTMGQPKFYFGLFGGKTKKKLHKKRLTKKPYLRKIRKTHRL
jgi:hypothetical protein